MFKKGDLDFYHINRAQMWVEELNFDKVQAGLIQKRKVFNHNPQGIGGIALNTRRPPYDDIRVRKALRHLYNRELMVEKLAFNEYLLTNSHFPASAYESPDVEKIEYNPQKAMQFLAEAGWKERDSAGRLMKNGRPLTLELIYYDRASERYNTIFQEDLRKAGININLRYVTPETAFKLIDEKQFDMVSVAYGGSDPFPLPDQMYHSSQTGRAGQNITGLVNKRVDEIIDIYDKTFDINERIKLLKELDTIVSNEHHWILEWYGPYQRFAYWNKFGQPKGSITRIGFYIDPVWMWWADPQKTQQLQQAMRDSSIKMEVGPSEDRYWLDFQKIEEQERN
jgi:microcin C transport system substrate-binding protein